VDDFCEDYVRIKPPDKDGDIEILPEIFVSFDDLYEWMKEIKDTRVDAYLGAHKT